MGSNELWGYAAENRANIENLRRDLTRLQDSVDDQESRLSTVALLSRMVTELEQNLPNLARQAAREIYALERQQRSSRWRDNWRLILSTLSFGVALGGLIVALLLR